jgi:serine/threonine protein kinase
LIDFGLATDSNQVARNFAGTARYASPEVVKEKEYTSKSEIYSLGILFFFILTGSYPYNIAKITDPGYRLLIELKF